MNHIDTISFQGLSDKLQGRSFTVRKSSPGVCRTYEKSTARQGYGSKIF